MLRMQDLKSRYLGELTNRLPDGVRFELYMHGRVKPGKYKAANQNVENIQVLLEELKREYGLTYEIKDTHKMSQKAVKAAYRSSVHWIMTTKWRPFTSRKIHEIFVGGEAGDYFGKEVPAMIVYDSLYDIYCVLPHIFEGSEFHLPRKSERKTETITIYDYLSLLKKRLRARIK